MIRKFVVYMFVLFVCLFLYLSNKNNNVVHVCVFHITCRLCNITQDIIILPKQYENRDSASIVILRNYCQM